MLKNIILHRLYHNNTYLLKCAYWNLFYTLIPSLNNYLTCLATMYLNRTPRSFNIVRSYSTCIWSETVLQCNNSSNNLSSLAGNVPGKYCCCYVYVWYRSQVALIMVMIEHFTLCSLYLVLEYTCPVLLLCINSFYAFTYWISWFITMAVIIFIVIIFYYYLLTTETKTISRLDPNWRQPNSGDHSTTKPKIITSNGSFKNFLYVWKL